MVTKIQDGPAIETKFKVGNFETKQKNTASESFRKGLLDLFHVYLLCLADITCMINISKVLKKKNERQNLTSNLFGYYSRVCIKDLYGTLEFSYLD